MTSKVISQDRKNISEKVRVFDRGQIARILDLAPAVVRNWSIGKPFRITPSVRAPGKKGSSNLYTLRDVYLFGFLARLSSVGMRTGVLNAVISSFREHPEWMDKNWKGMVSLSSMKGPELLQIIDTHKHIDDATWLISLEDDEVFRVEIIIKPKQLWVLIDKRIAKLEKEGNL
jgi:hypothetical protein